MRAPPCVTAPGKIMMKLAPSELMFDWIDTAAPLPMPFVTMTHPTPMTIPSIVSAERILFRAIERSPTFTMLAVRRTTVFIELEGYAKSPPRQTPRGLLEPQRLDRVERRGFPRRVEAEEDADERREAEGDRDRLRVDRH